MADPIKVTSDTSKAILQSCIQQIDSKLGPGYAKKNPQLLSSVVDLNKVIYSLSKQS